jgi:hypothetical protein
MASHVADKTDPVTRSEETSAEGKLHIQPRDANVDGENAAGITGYDHERMKDRGLLSYEEEKKLLRRVDIRLMILCAVIFMIKNVDANNVSLSDLGAVQTMEHMVNKTNPANSEGCACSYNEPWNRPKHYDTAQNDC